MVGANEGMVFIKRKIPLPAPNIQTQPRGHCQQPVETRICTQVTEHSVTLTNWFLGAGTPAAKGRLFSQLNGFL
jgi:hypothetical protein